MCSATRWVHPPSPSLVSCQTRQEDHEQPVRVLSLERFPRPRSGLIISRAHAPGLSTRANLIAFVVIGFFGTIAFGFASIGRYVHFGYWRLVWVAAWCVIVVVSGVYGIAVVRDFMEGPRTMTVTSCQLTQKAHYKPSDDHSKIIDYYDNHFTMTLEDGTTRTLRLQTDSSDDLANSRGGSQTIYETCKARSGATSLTVDVYRHSWIVVDARVE